MNFWRVYRKYLLASLVLMFTACGRCGWGTYYLNGTRSYSGDGTISDASVPSGFFGTRGYVIDFPTFDLGQRFEASYHLSGVPTLGVRAPAEISMMVDDPRGFLASSVDSLKDMFKAILKCSLSDSSGAVITKFEAPLNSLIWSSPIHGRSGYALYELHKSFFVPNSKEKYTLTIEYSGDPGLSGKTASIYLWCACGGS